MEASAKTFVSVRYVFTKIGNGKIYCKLTFDENKILMMQVFCFKSKDSVFF